MVGSPAGPGPWLNLRTLVDLDPVAAQHRRRARGGEDLKPRSASRLTGKMIEPLVPVGHRDEDRAARWAATRTRPPGSWRTPSRSRRRGPSPRRWSASPGPRIVSTEVPSTVRNRLNGITASLTAIGAPGRSSVPSPVAPQQALGPQLGDGRAEHDAGRRLGQRGVRGLGDERHRTARARVGLEHEQGVPGQRELDVDQPADARRRRRWPRSRCGSGRRPRLPRVIGGSAQAESPECTPASSMCSMTPPR